MSRTGAAADDIKWRKAKSSAGDGACVEVALVESQVAVRDSRDPDGTWLLYSAQPWRDFTSTVKSGGVIPSSPE
jgi:Domain of unknown function (DUF397)